MKRSDIKITLKDRIKECNREIGMRNQVYARQVEQKLLSPYRANHRILIIQEYKELVEELENRGLSWDDLLNHLESIKKKEQPKQAEMNFSYPS